MGVAQQCRRIPQPLPDKLFIEPIPQPLEQFGGCGLRKLGDALFNATAIGNEHREHPALVQRHEFNAVHIGVEQGR